MSVGMNDIQPTSSIKKSHTKKARSSHSSSGTATSQAADQQPVGQPVGQPGNQANSTKRGVSHNIRVATETKPTHTSKG